MSLPPTNANPFGRDSSKDTSFRMTTTELVSEALDICQIGVEEDDIDPEMYKRAVRSLNLVVSSWQAQGIHLWTFQEATLFLEGGKNKYTLEQSKAVNSDKYVITTATGAASSGTNVVDLTTITLTDNAGDVSYLDFGWTIGFLKTDNTFFWTTVESIAVLEVTLADNLPEDITTSTTIVFFERPLSSVERILDVRRQSGLFGGNISELPIKLTSHQDFMRLPNKNSQGSINQCTYDRVLSQGVLRVWPTPINDCDQVTITYERMIDNFFEVDNCADIPRYYLNALVYALADSLGIKFRVPQDLQMQIKARAMEELDLALSFDDANYDMTIELNQR